jgi:glycosidase
MQHLARWRRQSEAIVKGDLIQFIPEKGIYAYARVSAEESVLVILNSNTEEVEIDLKKYKDVLKGMDKYQLILEQMSYSESQKVKILPHGFQILSFKIIDNEK